MAELDVPRRMARGQMRQGGAFPGSFEVALCSQNANLSNREKSLILASAQGKLATPDTDAHVVDRSPRPLRSRETMEPLWPTGKTKYRKKG